MVDKVNYEWKETRQAPHLERAKLKTASEDLIYARQKLENFLKDADWIEFQRAKASKDSNLSK